MSALTEILNAASGIIWGPIMLVLLLGTGVFLTIGLKAMPWRQLIAGFKLLWSGRRSTEKGDITPFQALMTALAATIGTGNIAGVATAIFLGGPGAVFWMWITALVGMATKYSEAVLAVKYREVDERGRYVGGPMYYIKNGLSKRWHWLGFAFAGFGMIAAFGIGNMVQANSVAHAMESSFNTPAWATGLVITVVTAFVILGGVKRIATVAAKLVPIMAIAYVAGALWIIFANIGDVPAALSMIVNDAFTGTAAKGGFAGAAVWAAIRFGVARGIFSNEAGLGSAPIAHAAARTNEPVREGLVAMLEPFIDTLVICTMTGLVIVVTGAWQESGEALKGAALPAHAFGSSLGDAGAWVVGGGLTLFAYSTILGWSYYGEKSLEFLFGIKAIKPYRYVFTIFVGIGAIAELELVWAVADIFNALIADGNG